MTDELDRLERRAQEVRGQLALDLDELFVRLQPRRMVRSVGVYARDREAGGDLGRDVIRDMRHTPVPYLLIGIGIAGLVWAVSSVSRGRTRARLPEFSEADFVPPASPRVAGTPVGKGGRNLGRVSPSGVAHQRRARAGDQSGDFGRAVSLGHGRSASSRSATAGIRQRGRRHDDTP